MSNKTQLQTNNTKYASLIETLRGKAVSNAEDLNTELTEQENLISQLSNILDSKASGGSGSSVETCTVDIGLPNSLVPYFICFTDANMSIVEETTASAASYTIVKGTILTILDYSYTLLPLSETIVGDISIVQVEQGARIYAINGNGSITIS